MRYVDNFEEYEDDYDAQNFSHLFLYQTTNQLKIYVRYEETYKNVKKGIVETSGVRDTNLKNPPPGYALFGKKELVVGDASIVGIYFPKPATNLLFHYFQVLNYTKEDIAHTGKELNELRTGEKSFFCTLYLKDKLQARMPVPPSFNEVRWGEYSSTEFDKVEFENGLIGSLHLDQISWEDD